MPPDGSGTGPAAGGPEPTTRALAILDEASRQLDDVGGTVGWTIDDGGLLHVGHPRVRITAQRERESCRRPIGPAESARIVSQMRREMTDLEVLTIELPSRDEYEQHVASMLRQGWTVQAVTPRSHGKRLLRLVPLLWMMFRTTGYEVTYSRPREAPQP